MAEHSLTAYLPAGVEPVWAEIRDIAYTTMATPVLNSAERDRPQLRDLTLFNMHVALLIGPRGGTGWHEFSLCVKSLRWLAEAHADPSRSVTLRTSEYGPSAALADFLWPTFVMSSWDQEVFEARLHRLCWAVGPGPDWGSVAMRLGEWLDLEQSQSYAASTNAEFGKPYWGPGRTSP
jgi:hypothetical protein